ncbi:MAG: hypothetical protein N4A68_13590 [Maledivibacter sp.]|jgi:hypothetical protein|nr:hypothetical protein [Maledivibacter sp.]
MGDGRYYTPEQFFSVTYLTILIVFMTVSIMLCLYKGSGNKISKQILIPNVTLCIIAVLSFSEQVIVIQQKAFVIRYIISLLFIIVNFLFISFNLDYVIDVSHRSKRIRILKHTLYIIIGLVLITSFLKKELIIKSYGFSYVEYGDIFFLSIVISFFFLIYIVVSVIHNKNNEIKFSKKVFLLSICLFWIFPIIIYISSITLNILNIKTVELINYIFMAICLSTVSGLFTPYRVSASIFNDVRNLMMDYVFITEENGKIIYKNNRVEKVGIFRNINSVDIEDIRLIFNKEVVIRDSYKNQFVKYLGDEIIYMGYSKKSIIKNNKLAGYIITFTDITELINMLDELNMKQSETVKANAKLSHYKEIVYDIEKEKEINNLLDEIANNQQKSMLELKCDIDDVKISLDGDFIQKISKIITNAKHDLQDVRKAVTAYMNYYGGEND